MLQAYSLRESSAGVRRADQLRVGRSYETSLGWARVSYGNQDEAGRQYRKQVGQRRVPPMLSHRHRRGGPTPAADAIRGAHAADLEAIGEILGPLITEQGD